VINEPPTLAPFVHSFYNRTGLREPNVFASKHLCSKAACDLLEIRAIRIANGQVPADSCGPEIVPLEKMRSFLIPLRVLVSARSLPAFIAFCFVFSTVSHAQTQIVAFGASNVAGKGVWPSQAWPAQLEDMLKAKGYNVRVKNAGKSGDTTSGMLHRLDSAIPPGTKIVILDMGGGYFNNRNTTAASQQRGSADMNAIEAQLKSRGIITIREIAATMPLTLKQTDKIHLTPEGHKILATRLLPRVISALGSSSSGG
jgi:acyl-CoA thioesterase-1